MIKNRCKSVSGILFSTIIIILIMVLPGTNVNAANISSKSLEGKIGLILDHETYAPGAEITVFFAASSKFASNAWIGIIPAEIPHGKESVNDQHDLAYKYISKKLSGIMKFTAPNKPGSYDIRMHTTDSNGKEVAFVNFTVK